MKELISKVSEDLTKSILSETFIDQKSIQVKIEAALKILLSKSIRPAEVNVKFLEDKMRKRNFQARRDALERDFCKGVAKTYIGENHIQEYYERLNVLISKIPQNDNS